MNRDIETLTRRLAQSLVHRGAMIVTAESCTGGLIAKTLTDLAGSSEWFDRGFVTYSNDAKVDMLGVNQATLQEYGAVSEQVAREMVIGALRRSKAQMGLSVTGVAGPGGGSVVKPVGSVWFGFALAGQVNTFDRLFQGNREAVRLQSLEFALQTCLRMLRQS